MEDVEARFAHLLQPIRDLTKNWEVDVAAQLGEYLEEVSAAPGEWRGAGGRGREAGRRAGGCWAAAPRLLVCVRVLTELVLRLVSFFFSPSSTSAS